MAVAGRVLPGQGVVSSSYNGEAFENQVRALFRCNVQSIRHRRGASAREQNLSLLRVRFAKLTVHPLDQPDRRV
jgi:hypothetical protein